MIIPTVNSPACATCRAPATVAAPRAGGTIYDPATPYCDTCYANAAADTDEYGTPAVGPIRTQFTATQQELTMSTTTQTLSEQLAPLAAELASIAADKAELDAREKELKAQIRTMVDGPDKYAAGPLTITVSANRRFDPRLAEKVLPTELLDLCRIAKVDSAAAKEVLPPALYAQCMTDVGDYRVGLGR